MFRFSWDQDNIDHIARHDVTVAECEYVLVGGHTMDLPQQDWHERYAEAGITQHGRLLYIVTTWLDEETLRVVTAYDAPPNVVREYRRIRGTPWT